jgi:pimeloyl-ACP methyl ester carboxylesterase
VFVPPNPLRSLDGDSAYIADYLSTIPGPIVLVGHSYGGAVITNAATGNPNVKALVYVDAFAPDDGELVVGLAGADSALNAPPETVFDFRPYPGAPEGDADLYLKQDVFLNSFAPDVARKKALVMYASQKPVPFSALTQTSGAPAWKTIPSWYLLGKQDKIITPDAQRFMAERAESHIKEINASHVSLVSRPQAVTSLIVQAARQTS